MNKRIQELAEQAGYKHPDAVGMCEDYAYFDHKKFAELIIRECSDVATINAHQYQPPGDYILKHFGIE